MVKVLAGIFMITLLFSVLVGATIFCTAQNSTKVRGIITSDTTWIKANSPYIFDQHVTVDAGVTLTIEPGVFIDINQYSLAVDGNLHARGSSSENINFFSDTHGSSNRGGYIIFGTDSKNWDEQTGSGCIIENAILNFTYHPAVTIVNASPKINNNTIYSDIEIERLSSKSSSPIITENNITGTIYAGSCSPIISKNTITNSIYGIEGGGNNTLISNNFIYGCEIGINLDKIYGTTPKIERNLIENNNLAGIQIMSGSPEIENNTIINNFYGVSINVEYGDPKPVIVGNNIYENREYNIILETANDVDVTFNWWGTTDAASIQESIFDFEDSLDLGNVIFVPFLTMSNPKAPVATSDGVPEELFPFELVLVAIVIIAAISASIGLLIYLLKRK
jgi:hypothetical protein